MNPMILNELRFLMTLRYEANSIVKAAIHAVLPDIAVKNCLEHRNLGDGRIVMVAVGKGAWRMASAAVQTLGNRIERGVVVTKYDHVQGELPRIRCYEAGHPIPDENSFIGTQAAIEMVSGLQKEDTVLFLLSGGGSALFEKPLIEKEELEKITAQLLACGADIVEINTIRKRLSAVKGGKFAKICSPAHVECIVLSDVLGNRIDTIASGPVCPDESTCQQAADIAEKYHLEMSEEAQKLIRVETPKKIANVSLQVIGSVSDLCATAANQCRELGYDTTILTECLSCEAKDAGIFLSNIAQYAAGLGKKMAFIAGGETVVHLRGKGKGGRNQELSLAAAPGIAGLNDVAVFSVGSDGTDGVTDAAGGFVDGCTIDKLKQKGISVFECLEQNDSYHALQMADGLIITGATGTNVNDISVVLVNGRK